jgi:hypothetical protein
MCVRIARNPTVTIPALALSKPYAISRVLGVGKDEAKRTHTEAARAMLNGTLTKSANSVKELNV